jgi:hypothetical protein
VAIFCDKFLAEFVAIFGEKALQLKRVPRKEKNR